MTRTRRHLIEAAAAVALLLVLLLLPAAAWAADKKKSPAPQREKHVLEMLDYSKIVWPNPPAITRIRFLDHFFSEPAKPVEEKKLTWKDRLAGMATGETRSPARFQLVVPYGIAIDSKGRVYVADSKVRAIFIFDTKTKHVDFIKNGVHARFTRMTGLAMDDGDRLFVSDSEARRVIVFDPQHKVEGSIGGMFESPGGLAVDNENRFLYVADAGLDQIMVFDADPPYKLIRVMGTSGKDHSLTGEGDFSMPSNVALDKDGNLYVSDTWNNRIQIFDADGKFIRAFGKAGDGPGYFARPKGIAVDSDGHIWVADAVQNRVQVFTPEGQLLIHMGGHGMLPGQFRTLAGLAIDKNNRVFTTEQFPGRLQMFQYVPDGEAMAERARRMGAKESEATAAAKPAKSP